MSGEKSCITFLSFVYEGFFLNYLATTKCTEMAFYTRLIDEVLRKFKKKKKRFKLLT